ncbi:MAG: Nramp family divalent metal transporter [Methanomicrobiaceae archaeon]|uniref:Manganese transport protein mnth n=1 Tax=hydrocarbon metagenome TaxID=938273 RepID=A0A0W8FHT7_9ZZZZ|nr:Nramp family divalent metal transporter [Methanomicrobiaceae archaeon]MDD5420032.1 Nramp family divalent metal transporter [Methanomicrobiaceae archaeon]
MAEEREIVPPAPQGREIAKWVGPGIIWMISAIATGELLFTPRIASLYGYAVLWTMILAIFLKALLAREIGRYAVVTGGSLLQGIRTLPGPRNWGVWLIVLPQIFVAVTTIVGMAGAASSALILAVPGDFRVWGLIFLAISLALVFFGKYQGVEWASIVMALVIIVALIITAGVVFPGVEPLAAGLVPALPPDADFTELLPWIGFMMSGAAGLIWYSYWLTARGYGSAHSTVKVQEKRGALAEPEEAVPIEEAEAVDISDLSREQHDRLRAWIRIMTISTVTAASIVLVLLVALLILGTELLRPAGLLPEGPEVTAVLSVLLGDVWGAPGAWLMILAAFFAFWSTIVANLDGWTRMLGQGTIFILRQFGVAGRAVTMHFYRYAYLLGLMGVIPAIFIWIRPEPVQFLIVAGIVEAIHIPVVACATLYLNLRMLPDEFRPAWYTTVLTFAVALFFIIFAGYYIYAEVFV